MQDADDPVLDMAASGLASPPNFDPQAVNQTAEYMRHSPPPSPIADAQPEADPFALPAWLDGADAEERRELEELGVVVAPEFTLDAERDALISRMMRAVHEHTTDVERYNAAEQMEHQAITARYDRLRAPAQRQLARLGSFIIHLVSGAVFIGRKKSRTVGWGSFGVRKDRDKVEITNLPEVVAYFVKHDPARVTVKIETNADLVQRAEFVITALLSNEAVVQLLDGVDASVLSEIRAALKQHDASVSKTDVGQLLKQTKDDGSAVHNIPGAAITIGADKPWYEVEPQTNAE